MVDVVEEKVDDDGPAELEGVASVMLLIARSSSAGSIKQSGICDDRSAPAVAMVEDMDGPRVSP